MALESHNLFQWKLASPRLSKPPEKNATENTPSETPFDAQESPRQVAKHSLRFPSSSGIFTSGSQTFFKIP